MTYQPSFFINLFYNLYFYLFIAGFIVFYYFSCWLYLCAKAKGSAIITPLYDPPENLSPLDVSYIVRMDFSPKTLTIAIMTLAVKGILLIESKTYGNYKLVRKKSNASGLTDQESLILKNIFYSSETVAEEYTGGLFPYGAKSWRDTFNLSSRDLAFQNIEYQIAKNLAKKYKNNYFSLNLAYLFFPLDLVIGILFIDLIYYPSSLGVRCSTLLLIFVVICMFIFQKLFKKATANGRKIINDIAGFKQFLTSADNDRLDILTATKSMTEIFENYLPYAIALDVEDEWSNIFISYMQKNGDNLSDYHPDWYHGRYFNLLRMDSFFQSLNTSISTAAASKYHMIPFLWWWIRK